MTIRYVDLTAILELLIFSSLLAVLGRFTRHTFLFPPVTVSLFLLVMFTCLCLRLRPYG